MSRLQFILMVVCLISTTIGCRGRYNSPSNGWFAGNSTVAPPPTYSLSIPSMANNRPYYTPGSGVNPGTSAPPPANLANPVNQAGWRSTGNNLPSGADAGQGGTRSVITTPTTFVETQPNPAFGSGVAGFRQNPQVARLPATGNSYTISPNYQSTQIDERQDATRLPVTDASQVRAPSQYNPTGNAAMYQQQNPYYPRQQTFASQAGVYGSPTGYSGSTQLVGGQPSSYQGQAVLTSPYVSAPPTVAGQGGSGQVGWRAREMNSDQINRF